MIALVPGRGLDGGNFCPLLELRGVGAGEFEGSDWDIAKLCRNFTHSLSSAIIISVSVSTADSGHEIMKSTLSAG